MSTLMLLFQVGVLQAREEGQAVYSKRLQLRLCHSPTQLADPTATCLTPRCAPIGRTPTAARVTAAVLLSCRRMAGSQLSELSPTVTDAPGLDTPACTPGSPTISTGSTPTLLTAGVMTAAASTSRLKLRSQQQPRLLPPLQETDVTSLVLML